MLVLKRKEGQWIDITHKSGDVIRVRVYRIGDGQLDMAFDDQPRNFEVQRPERKGTMGPSPLAEAVHRAAVNIDRFAMTMAEAARRLSPPDDWEDQAIALCSLPSDLPLADQQETPAIDRGEQATS